MPDKPQAQSDVGRTEPSRAQTWISLLAHWTEFAQAAKALPTSGEGGRWKSATSAIITLQAVTFALADLHALGAEERRLGVDRAQILVRASTATILNTWKDQALPEGLAELIEDASAALSLAQASHTSRQPRSSATGATDGPAPGAKTASAEAAMRGGLEWCVAGEQFIAEHPAALVESLLASGFEGDLFVPTPGVPLFEGCPMVFASAPTDAISDDARALIENFFDATSTPVHVVMMRQAYRQFDFGKGRAVRDLVLPANVEPSGGQPLLMCAIRKGQPLSVPLPIRGAAAQTALPVEFATPSTKKRPKAEGR